jgi:hypothetical protein
VTFATLAEQPIADRRVLPVSRAQSLLPIMTLALTGLPLAGSLLLPLAAASTG